MLDLHRAGSALALAFEELVAERAAEAHVAADDLQIGVADAGADHPHEGHLRGEGRGAAIEDPSGGSVVDQGAHALLFVVRARGGKALFRSNQCRGRAPRGALSSGRGVGIMFYADFARNAVDLDPGRLEVAPRDPEVRAWPRGIPFQGKWPTEW